MTPETIISTISEYYRLNPADVKGKLRYNRLIRARHISMYFIKEIEKITFQATANYFHGVNHAKKHSTVIAAIKSVNNQIDTDKKYAKEVFDIRTKLNEMIEDTKLFWVEHDEVFQENDFY